MKQAWLIAEPVTRFIGAANRFITVGGTRFAYRELGPRGGVPRVLLNRWGAVLDNFDPWIVDGLASQHNIIAINYRGIVASGGKAPETIPVLPNTRQPEPAERYLKS